MAFAFERAAPLHGNLKPGIVSNPLTLLPFTSTRRAMFPLFRRRETQLRATRNAGIRFLRTASPALSMDQPAHKTPCCWKASFPKGAAEDRQPFLFASTSPQSFYLRVAHLDGATPIHGEPVRGESHLAPTVQ